MSKLSWFMKEVFIQSLILSLLIFGGAIPLHSCREVSEGAPKVTEYKPKAESQESTCSMPMCESLGGHDAIALQVMSGD